MSTVGVDLGVWKYTQNRTLSHRISHVGFCRTGSCSLAALVSFYEMTRTVHIQYRSRVLDTPKNDDVSSSTGRLLCHSPVFPIQAVSLSRPLERQRRRRRHKRIGIVASKHSGRRISPMNFFALRKHLLTGESARCHRHISRFSHRREEKRYVRVNVLWSFFSISILGV